MRIGVILVYLLLLVSITGCKTDKRAKALEKYIIERADSVGHSYCTEENIQKCIFDYYTYGNLYTGWIENIKDEREIHRNIIKENSVIIHSLDKEAGKELSILEAFNIIMETPDTTSSGNPDSIVRLKRSINQYSWITYDIILWQESKKYEKKSKYKPDMERLKKSL